MNNLKEGHMLVKTKILGFMLTTMVVLTSSISVYADSSHQAGEGHHQKWDHSMYKSLKLSENQEKLLQDSRQKQKKTMKSIYEQMKSNREEFNAEIVKAKPDMKKINRIQARFKDFQSQIVGNYLNSILEIKKILTPEQFAGYMTLENERKLMRHEGHH
jgi:Spy/CpxP family protein refolding chaperone